MAGGLRANRCGSHDVARVGVVAILISAAGGRTLRADSSSNDSSDAAAMPLAMHTECGEHEFEEFSRAIRTSDGTAAASLLLVFGGV